MIGQLWSNGTLRISGIQVTRLPNEEWPQRETTLEKYLPGSSEIQKECK